jgi:hypothetical protein
MRRLSAAVLVLAALACPIGQAIGQPVLSVCDYTPPESRLMSLNLQGSFQWYDGPYADDRTRTVLLTAGADYGVLFSSSSSGHRLDANAELRGSAAEWSFALRGDGDLKAFWTDDLFGLGAFGVDGSNEGLEVDVTAGVGTGRFRDVTPMAKAIRVQNGLLDLGVLLAPLERESLLALAQRLGDAASTDEEKTVALAEHLISTGLVKDDDLGVRGLLAIEEIVTSSEGGRLCGGDAQARIGVAAMVMPEVSLATTGIVLYNVAFVPDPVSQLTSSASCKVRLAHLDELSAKLDLSYSRRLPEGWTARADYRFTLDRGWSQPGETQVGHDLSANLTTQLLGSIGVSLAAELRYETGDEEITSSLTVHLAYDLF